MKIALCLSGQPRFLDEGYGELYTHLLSKYSVDCFVHCWWSPNMANINMNTLGMANPHGRSYIFKSDTIECIQRYYSPVSFIHEPQKQFEFIDGVYLQQPNKTTSVQSMWYSVKMANHLKTEYEKAHSFKYDVVIRSRMDVIIHTLSLDRLTETGCVYTDCVGENMDFPNDQFAVSDSASSDYYSSLYDNLISYKDEGFTWFVGERLLKYHMAKTNIKSCYTPFISNNIFKTI
jgi:hypothetical protein